MKSVFFSYVCALTSVMAIFTSFIGASINLEDRTQDFVLESKRINIPGFPHAFNPSIIRWNGSLLMSFRTIPSEYAELNELLALDPLLNCSGESRIGLVWLDESFSPRGPAQILDLQGNEHSTPARSEDARLVLINDCLYMVYSDNREVVVTNGGFRVYVSQIFYEGGEFLAPYSECLDSFEGESQQRREKNWVPFDYKGHLLMSYSLLPHRILRPLIGTGQCETFSMTKSSLLWKWGELRGGTPGLLVGDEYLSFFHSSIDISTSHSNNEIVPHYFMGAYTFSSNPPFSITQISKEPIIGKNFYNGDEYKPYWKPVRVVFPCGFIFDNEYVWVAYGRQDHEVWMVKLDRKGLFDSLEPVYSN